MSGGDIQVSGERTGYRRITDPSGATMRIAERYHLESLLGCGGMGEVWRATDEVLTRPVAVKLLKPGTAGRSAAERFRREARAAAAVNDPHVVGVHDFGWTNDDLYLVMELIVGTTLAEQLRRYGRLTPSDAVHTVEQTAEGLLAAHDHGVVHRDIKPSNLLVAADNTIKIADFGIACFLADGHGAPDEDEALLGTSFYIAPERARAEAAGPPADIYSLGCVLYQLLTGTPPFVADTPTGVLHHHVADAPDPPEQVDHELRRYLLRMLAKNPAERPDAAEVVDWCRKRNLADGNIRARMSTTPPPDTVLEVTQPQRGEPKRCVRRGHSPTVVF
jgi:serine/threonine protein kinase